ncbi:LysR family transcriptional regulator [Streptomyces sp. MBT62]|uniref:LysR family transcriptional regulator n=1 Tax=Streptomyces sp. MBT62 TaxID=2800410 RepID=UPI001909B3D2|nr:LysR family transcriptional regulator [Streptomyces sp. MBT62]MBK3567984.1 LysR family transcriptional regulator [Streptomyces sp. MBT62]
MPDLDLRRLRYFLILADELNYGRAAEILHIAQPALSRSIAALERELEVRLFQRSRRGTRLTPAGELLREDARELLRSAEVLQRRVRGAEREGRSVTIGFMPGLVLTPVVRHLEERFPGLRVDVVRSSWSEQITAVRDGRFDASFAHRPFDDEGLTVVDLYSESRAAALPIDDPRAGRSGLSLADLADDVLLQPAEAVPGWRGAAAPPGLERDRFVAVSPTVEEKFELVAAGRGIVVIPESATRYYHRPDLAFVQVTDLPQTMVCLVVESRRHSAVLLELAESARTALCAGPAATAHTDAASVGNQPVLDESAQQAGG